MRPALVVAVLLAACSGTPGDGEPPGDTDTDVVDTDRDTDPVVDTDLPDDADGDGFVAIARGGVDCDDHDALVHPGATERCNGVDDDCDGVTDRADASFPDARQVYLDLDNDGFGTTATWVCPALASGFATADGDCDDADPDVNPDAREFCNTVDDNCNGQQAPYDPTWDLGHDPAWVRSFVDVDQDGWGVATLPVHGCFTAVAGSALQSGDCDDADPEVNPGRAEVCNGVDDDCNGRTDDRDRNVQAPYWVVDADGDGFPGERTWGRTCTSPGAGWTPTLYVLAIDCDDDDAFAFWQAAWREEDKCSRDADGDGWGDPAPPHRQVDAGRDCDDDDVALFPGATEVFHDGVDQDCDRSDDDDEDGDGALAPVWGGDDCDDQDPRVASRAADQDCDGTPDVDDCFPTDPTRACEVNALAAGGAVTCAAFDGGTVRCWGDGRLGATGQAGTALLGDDELPVSAPPVDVGGPVVTLAAGRSHVCALRDDAQVVCWGDNLSGAVGAYGVRTVGDDETPASAGPVLLRHPTVALAAGPARSCVVRPHGRTSCWGDGRFGANGNRFTIDLGYTRQPGYTFPVQADQPIRAVSSGETFTCGLYDDGSVHCWGRIRRGHLGVPGLTGTMLVDPSPALSFGAALSIASGDEHTCAVTLDHHLVCWGRNVHGQLGLGHDRDIGDDEEAYPAGLVDLPPVRAVAAGAAHTCALLMDQTVRCWGEGADGRLGNLSSADIGDDEPIGPAVDVGGPVRAIAAGEAHTCVILDNADEDVVCWGYGADGRLGYGTTDTIGDDETPASAGPVAFR
ncbi:MAG: hypothetical protein H6733_18015 [Alphaproteobacteria bacterium]|nr:hypothetical protein [Alphaproteobacteria bacterium]